MKAAYYGPYLRFLLGGIKPRAAIVIRMAAKEEVQQSPYRELEFGFRVALNKHTTFMKETALRPKVINK